ncbi:Por secretion system C-terminal sorting domain-containing protein [Chryseobacterium soldanellicola]|uniref:Por secretion system C-terminal sorting domain-containing protein n=1 Tax=Chryseobacterium soldanellicola TaxID=311333 RepID=A0A1H1E3D2_9FLAO|nr:zinc-dependent metalloprotease family protein [Chryseobacterium soldanellicola]SDQ83281.1 Por secretion system C-terminal sorting domain-containing protein [Chryseobacterium soldanellicola]
MKKLITVLFCSLIGGTAFAQWTPTTVKKGMTDLPSIADSYSYFKLDLNKIKEQLRNAQETGPNAKSVEISLPTLDGKIERFAVYSFPVVVKELADQYQLGSYVGVGIDDPSKTLRFSVAPNDFQSMIIKNGSYEFIEPTDNTKTVYKVHAKSKRTEGKSFLCSTTESPAAVNDINDLYKQGSTFSNQTNNFSKNSDKKYRTMRLVMSVTGEYTAFHGGTLAGALAAINATLTRVNGVFEKDFALHLNLQNYPAVIYLDAATDPYSPAATGAAGAWNQQLQTTLTANVGNENYDIGHLFGASGGGGNAGCIGCVCINPTTAVPKGKGSGYTSPADGIPQGDNFDIDYVAHEMGHQLGGNHTFSHALEGSGVNVEPGSGTTIMGYAGITGPTTDVQPHSDAYFHIASIKQIQANLISKTCDVETNITNNPPVITALPTYNIPKGTAFVLTASVTDPENDPMTYTWEEMDDASVLINSSNLGTTSTGASFRSVVPTTSPTRYFPKLSSVLAGVLNNSNNGWESVSMVPRTTKFTITARDNNPAANQQQTQYADQTIVVGNEGPFKVNTQYASHTVPTTIEWDAAGTTAAPYNVANVKIDYTTDNGTTWTVASASTANDGSESITLPSSLNNQTIKLRISAIGNVFYAVKSISVSTLAVCDGSAPTNVTVSNITAGGATINWAPISGATYIIRYKKLTDTTWQQTTSTSPTVNITGLTDGTAYEVQVAAVCSGTPGTYSASTNFSTTAVAYCTAASTSGQFNYISNVTLATVNNTTVGTTYSDFTANPALQPLLLANSANNSISVSLTTTVSGASVNGMAVWIDYNKNGTFEASERVLNMPVTALPVGTTPKTGTFTVPSTALTNTPLRMRVVTVLINPTNVGLSIPDSFACGSFPNGEVEDYNVVVVTNLGTSDLANTKDGIQLYPNPATDVLNITKVSDKASYKIYSAAGQLVGNGTVSGGKINVSSLIKGVYMITIDDKGKQTFNSKFIKK